MYLSIPLSFSQLNAFIDKLQKSRHNYLQFFHVSPLTAEAQKNSLLRHKQPVDHLLARAEFCRKDLPCSDRISLIRNSNRMIFDVLDS